MDNHYTVKQAADVLGISTKTVRKRIANKEYPAVYEDRGPGMSQWWIPTEVIDVAVHTIETMPVKHTMSPAEVSQMIQAAVRETVREEMEDFQQKIEERAEQRDQKLMEVIRAIQEERSRQAEMQNKNWWQRLFGK